VGTVTKPQRGALVALLAGATGIGFAPILVRWSETGPSATAGFRVLFALPLLWLWARTEAAREHAPLQPTSAGDFLKLSGAGLFFIADLSLWHWSLQFTSVANSTLLANFAPIFVTIGARLFFREELRSGFLVGMSLALAGALMLVIESLELSRKHLLGDILAVIAAVSYAGYLLMVKRLRRRFSTATIMTWSGLVSCPGFFIVASISGDRLLSSTAMGWMVLIALALVCHVGGQTLIAYGLGHLPAAFSSVGLLWQPVVAALLAWVALHEPLSPLQVAGGFVVLAGIGLSGRASR
jgi:drug/metabolite transporter (DMT)-like permease